MRKSTVELGPASKPLRALTPISLFVRFVVMVSLGVMVLAAPRFVNRWLNVLCIGALLVNGLPAIAVSVFQRHRAHPHSLLGGIAYVALALVVAAFPQLPRKGVTLAVGVWSLLVCAVQLGYVAQLRALGEKGCVKFLILGGISLAAGLCMLSSMGDGNALRIVAGGYLILYGLWQLFDLIGILINRNVESSVLLSRLRVRPPVLLTAMLPSVVLRRLSAQYATLREDVITEKPSPSRRAWDDKLEVFFHLGDNVAMGFGHVDVSLRGRTYSYGCYDESSNRLFGLISDGVFQVCDTEKYIRYGQSAENKLLIGYTLGLSSDVAQKMEDGMRELFARACVPWEPENRPEYAYGARFYKVQSGSFRMYNALRTNCAAMAELIASGTGLKLLPSNGFVTPGSYFDYLQDELRDPQSNVLRMTVYGHRE